MATGGNNIYTIDVNGQSYRVHEFTEDGTFTPAVTSSLEYLVVAGGGAGGGNGGYAGGGGGAGGLLSGTFGPATGGQNYSIVVGAGGTPQSLLANKNDAKGGNSIAFGVTAYGGGGGSFIDNSTSPATGVSPTDGGSGGGGGGQILSRTFDGGSEIVSGQGRAGGNGAGSNTTLDDQSGGGGGGYSGVGLNGVNNNGGDGGPGVISIITGSSVYYSAGGGGGTRNGTGGNGGTGGGGDAGAPNQVGQDGQTYGSGGGAGSANVGGSGAGGIVIVRYAVTDVDISATSLTASAESFDASIVGNSGFEPNPVTASAELLSPTVVAIIGDSVNITTFIQVNASFPSNYSVSSSENVFNNIAITLNASASFPDLINITSTSDNSFAAESATATAELIEPLQQAFPMNANAELVDPTLNIDQSLYSIIVNENPHIYWDVGPTNFVNYGSMTDLYLSNPTAQDKNVLIEGQLAAVSEGTTWTFNELERIELDTFESNNGYASGEFLLDLKNSHDYSIEFWFYGLDLSINTSKYPGFTFRVGDTEIEYFEEAITVTTEPVEEYQVGVTPTGVPIFSTSITQSLSGVAANNWHHFAFSVIDQGDGTSNYLAMLDGGVFMSRNHGNVADSINGNHDRVEIIPDPDSVLYGDPHLFDHIVLHSKGLEASYFADSYAFVQSLSPDDNFFAGPASANAEMLDANVAAVFNVEFPPATFTTIASLQDPLITARQNISTTASLMIASALAVDETFAGTPDYRDLPEPMIAFAEELGGYHLSDVYYEYVQTNITPYRYVGFDGASPLSDDGTDNDYSVPSTIVNGSIVSPVEGITGRSAKTSGGIYSSDGIYLMESEHDDDWGTGVAEYHSSFWVQRTADDTSSGLRVVWNLNGAYDDQHVILYQYQNKLHLNFNNGSGTFIDQATVDDVDLFDFNRHFVIINFDHTGVNNFVKLFVDGFEIMEVDLGTYTGQTINSPTYLAPNDANNNFPRLSVGGLITTFANTALPVVPTNYESIFDEIIWAKTSVDATLALALFNIMPDKINANYFQTSSAASAEMLDFDEIITNVNFEHIRILANSELLEPTIVAEFENIFEVTETLNANAEILDAERVANVSFAASPMLAGSSLGGFEVGVGFTTTSMTAQVIMEIEDINVNTIFVSRNVPSLYMRYLVNTEVYGINAEREIV